MYQTPFPPLPLSQWRPSRDTLHLYSKLLGAVRRALAPPQKHWWHISLQTTANGLHTTPIHAGLMTFDMSLDFTTHELAISTSDGDWWEMSLQGRTPAGFFQDVLGALHTLGVEVELDSAPFAGGETCPYDAIAVEDYWQALAQVDADLKRFRASLRRETSAVQLWPHHFDLSLVWFSGRTVPGQETAAPEWADEQMAFGFSTGDESFANPYFYVTAYPWLERLPETSLPAGAHWQQDGWKGALLPYQSVQEAEAPHKLLLGFWQTVHEAGAAQMDSPDK